MYDQQLDLINPLMAKIRRNEDVIRSIDEIIDYLQTIKKNVPQLDNTQPFDIRDMERLMNEIKIEEKIGENAPVKDVIAPVSYVTVFERKKKQAATEKQIFFFCLNCECKMLNIKI